MEFKKAVDPMIIKEIDMFVIKFGLNKQNKEIVWSTDLLFILILYYLIKNKNSEKLRLQHR